MDLPDSTMKFFRVMQAHRIQPVLTKIERSIGMYIIITGFYQIDLSCQVSSDLIVAVPPVANSSRPKSFPPIPLMFSV